MVIMRRMREFIREYIPIWSILSVIFLALSLILYLFSSIFPHFADFVNSTVSFLVRYILATVSGIFHFSLFELCLIFALPLAVLIIVLAVKASSNRARTRLAFSLVGAVAFLYSLYLIMLGVGYKTVPLAEKMDLNTGEKITAEELYRLTDYIKNEINTLESEISFSDGESRMGLGTDEMSKKLSEAYDRAEEKYPFIESFFSRVKPVAFSSVMSDMGIMGIYGYFTGEANINISYPDYTLPYTAAHEMAHQRGIAREDEANFVAFLVCMESTDKYIKYSGYLNLFEYLSTALYYTDENSYRELIGSLSENALDDIRASAEVTREHKDSWIFKTMDKINDLYLKSNGTPGSVSYSYVVRLAVAYYKSEIN